MQTDVTETLEQFLARRHLKALREYERLTTYKWDDLKVGTELIMLRSGFGGYGGEHRVVSEILEHYKMVIDPYNPKQKFVVYESVARHHGGEEKEHFTELCYILTPEDLKIKNEGRWRDWKAHFYQKTGYDFR